MDSSPVDEAWETEGAAVSASDPPPSSQDHRTPLQVIADLRHPHLIVMRRNADGPGYEPELAGGMSLAELSRSEAGWFPLPLRVTLRILLDALSGLASVHQATQNGNAIDFVHGEVAPSNIIVGRDGLGRLVPVLPAHWNDRAQPNPDVTGYIAPERLLGDVFGQPADVFSAGVLLWEAITGKTLFRNWPLDAIVTQLIGRKVPYPIPFGDALWGVPLADVAMRALLVDPAERWAHVGALGAQVETIARGHLASSDEIAALVAGFAAGMGRGSMTSISDVETIPPPPPPAPAAVTSLAPTASSIIQAPPDDPESVAPVELPAPEPSPVAQRWEGPPPSGPRIWLPSDQNAGPVSTTAALASSDVADSWSGIAPYSAPGMSRRSKTVVWAAVSASLAIAGIAAYQLLDRSPEARSTATVLAPKVTPASRASAAPLAAAVPLPAREPTAATASTANVAAAPENSATSEAMRKVDEGSPAGLSASTAVPGSAPSAAAVTPLPVNRPATRPVARPSPPPVNAAPRPAAPATPPTPTPAPKPKPKEDIFGI